MLSYYWLNFRAGLAVPAAALSTVAVVVLLSGHGPLVSVTHDEPPVSAAVVATSGPAAVPRGDVAIMCRQAELLWNGPIPTSQVDVMNRAKRVLALAQPVHSTADAAACEAAVAAVAGLTLAR